jgi:hypothetical protein
MEFAPRAVTIHHTAMPNYEQWTSSPVYPNRMKGLTGWYRERQVDKKTGKVIKPAWSGGPHLFVDDKGMWLFNPLWKRGTHAFSFNGSAWGIEMVGNYDVDSVTAEPGRTILRNAALSTAVLLKKLGLPANSQTVLFHRDDPRADKSCPGKNVKKADFVALVKEAMGNGN